MPVHNKIVQIDIQPESLGRKIEEVMHKFKEGTLKSGKDGKNGKVTNRKQAIAIGISEAKEAGFKVPVQKEDK